MMPENRIKDCWEIRDSFGELFACATPIEAALDTVKKHKERRLVILPM